MKEKYWMGAKVDANIDRAARSVMGFALKQRYEFVCRGADGNIKWTDYIDNIVVNVGLDEILDKFWKGSTYTASHFVGLTDGTPTFAAGDTMASHAGWVDTDVYSEATRPALTLGSVASQSVDNSASKAVFSVDAGGSPSATIGGAFITTNNTVGGTTGILMGGGAFTGGDKTVSNGDTINVTVTLTAATA